MFYYSGLFADIELAFSFKYPGTAFHYGDSLKVSFLCDDAIVIPEEDVTDWMERWNVNDPAYSEYVISCSCACGRLMRYRRVVFHGASFLWRDKAYLFSAPSGTGKTTQVKLWEALFPDEVKLLNGDKPILAVSETKSVTVHPSPWKGKEGYGRDDICAPLGGIILLRQAGYNNIFRMEPAEAARNLFGRICSSFDAEEDVLNAAGILESIVTAAPVWLLMNKGDERSARMTHQFLLDKEGGL